MFWHMGTVLTDQNHKAILICGKERDISVLAPAVEASGFLAEAVSTCEEACHILENHPPKMVVAAWDTPGNGNRRTLSQKAHEQGVGLVCILDAQDIKAREDACNAGATDILFRPFVGKEIAARFKNFAEQPNHQALLEQERQARNQAEDAQMQSEFWYRELFDRMSVGAVILETQDQGKTFFIRDINRMGELLSDIRKHEVAGKNLSDIFPAMEEMGLVDNVRTVWSTGAPLHHSSRESDGRLEMWTDNNLSRMPSGEVLVFYQDISPRMQARLALEWELSVNKAMSDLAHGLLARHTTLEDIAEYALEQAKLITGSAIGYVSTIDPKTHENIIHTLMGDDTIALTPPDDGKLILKRGADGQYNALWGHTLNTGKGFFTNTPKQHPASKGVPKGHISLSRFLSIPAVLDGELVGQIAVANADRDYTDKSMEAVERLSELYTLAVLRERGREALRKSQRQWARSFDAMDDWVCLVNPDHRILRTNRAGEAFTGLKIKDIPGKTCCNLLRNITGVTLDCPVSRMKKSGKREQADMHLENGRWLLVTADPVRDERGALTGAVYIVRDLTQALKTAARRKGPQGDPQSS